MLTTVHVADLGVTGTIGALFRRPKPDAVPGLRSADVAVFAPLALSGPPPLRRAGLITFWDDDAAAEAYFATAAGRRFVGGFEARLRPLRAHGTWPGLPSELTDSRAVAHDGPVVVVTLARVKLPQVVRFLRTSRPAEKAVAEADGLIWASAAARPPFAATVSVWSSSAATAAYAYGKQRPAHSGAIAEQQRKEFHHESAFIRFAPVRLSGTLTGKNPFDATAFPVG